MAKDASKDIKKADANAPVLVRVHTGMGFWDNCRRRVGDEFYVPEYLADSSRWFSRADRPSPKVDIAKLPTPPGNANAVHPVGSPADLAKRRPASSAPRHNKPAVAEHEDGDVPQDETDPKKVDTQAIEKKPDNPKAPKPSGDAKVI